ncbi:MAG: lysophospholipid acyltransferase family protein [Gammaproteobacteria bacterium]|nr:lysophospholipid acyltransferase family protein [Gammaproteobacteria bacterium]
MTSNPYAKNTDENNSPEKKDNHTVENIKLRRQMTLKRKSGHVVLKFLLLLIVNVVWLTCRVKVIGQKNMDEVLSEQLTVIPCYWHQQHLFCGWYMLQQIKRGMKVGFLVSPSVDGEIPAKIVSSRGAKVIRGSSTRTGAKALRDMFQIITKDKISPVTTSDGPTGPIFKFKPGAAMLSQMTKAPMLPIACAAKSAWYLGSWDRFMIPKPFTKVVVAVGEFVNVDKAEKDLSPVQTQMEDAINGLMMQAKQSL